MTTIPMPNATSLVAPDLQARYSSTRALTEVLAGPLSPEDQTAQSMPDASPTKWHRGHTTWFFETFLLPGPPLLPPLSPPFRLPVQLLLRDDWRPSPSSAAGATNPAGHGRGGLLP